LDHYRLDEFEKMFILNFQKLSDNDLKTDVNFKVVYETLLKEKSNLKNAYLIGVAQKPLSLGYVYHIFMRTANQIIVRAEVYLELFSLKATVKSISNEDFSTDLLALSQQDKSITRILSIIEKQATNPSLQNNTFTVQSVQGKDFLFGKLFFITISTDAKNYVAYVYHDQSSE
jgi:hypothetical protein